MKGKDKKDKGKEGEARRSRRHYTRKKAEAIRSEFPPSQRKCPIVRASVGKTLQKIPGLGSDDKGRTRADVVEIPMSLVNGMQHLCQKYMLGMANFWTAAEEGSALSMLDLGGTPNHVRLVVNWDLLNDFIKKSDDREALVPLLVECTRAMTVFVMSLAGHVIPCKPTETRTFLAGYKCGGLPEDPHLDYSSEDACGSGVTHPPPYILQIPYMASGMELVLWSQPGGAEASGRAQNRKVVIERGQALVRRADVMHATTGKRGRMPISDKHLEMHIYCSADGVTVPRLLRGPTKRAVAGDSKFRGKKKEKEMDVGEATWQRTHQDEDLELWCRRATDAIEVHQDFSGKYTDEEKRNMINRILDSAK